MIEQKMDNLVLYFKHFFVTSVYHTETQRNLCNSDMYNCGKDRSDDEKKEMPVYWEFVDDPKVKPGYKKTYCYLSEHWQPCDKKDAQIVYISLFDENDVCVRAYHARKRRIRSAEN